MNIVKFTDGKYGYSTDWQHFYIIDDNTTIESIKASYTTPPQEYAVPVNMEASDKLNKFDSYKTLNKLNTTTIEDAKKFRTRVAELLYGSINDWDEEYDNGAQEDKLKTMLNYYKNNMYDDTIRSLKMFANQAAISVVSDCACCSGTVNTTIKNGCSCSGTTNISVSTSCDCISSYKLDIKNYMVSIYSDVEFWKLINVDILSAIITMLETIRDNKFPLSAASTSVDKLTYDECSCLSNDTQAANMIIIENTIKAFKMIKNGEIVANKNFIFNSLYAWSFKLYESMQWS